MSQITRPAITAEIAAKLADNTVGAITPAVIRGVMQDVTDSANIPATDGANQPLSTVLSSLSLSPTVGQIPVCSAAGTYAPNSVIGLNNSITISGAGDNVLTVPAGTLIWSFHVTVNAGGAPYTATCTLSSTNAQTGQRVLVRLAMPASKNSTVELMNLTYNGTRLDGTIGQVAAHVVTFECYFTGNNWMLINRLPVYDTNVYTPSGSDFALTIDSARRQYITSDNGTRKILLPPTNAGMTIDELGFEIDNVGTSNSLSVYDSTGTTTLYRTIVPGNGTKFGWNTSTWFLKS